MLYLYHNLNEGDRYDPHLWKYSYGNDPGVKYFQRPGRHRRRADVIDVPLKYTKRFCRVIPGAPKKRGTMMKPVLLSRTILLIVAITVIGGGSQASAAIPASERNALIDLYNSTGGANWTNNNGWLGAVGTECSWERVTCNFEETSVEQIRLYDHYLVGTLPDSLPDLSNLLYLDLSGNYLTGIPASLGSSPSLTHLILDDNNLSGSIPTTLGNLSTLQWLDLNDNDLTGSIPASLGNLTALRFLNLSVNQLTNSIPTSLGSLSSLEHLWLRLNDLTGSIPVEFGGLSSLQTLFLAGNELSGSIPATLGSLPFLYDIDLGNNQLSGSIPASLGSLPNLVDLELTSNQLSGSIPPELGNLSNLTDLWLGWNQLTGSIPPELGQLLNLEVLYLSANQLTGSIPPELGSLSNLGSLFLSSNQLSGTIPSEFGNLMALQYVWLTSNMLVGEIPTSLASTNIGAGHIDYNGLYTSDPALIAFLNLNFGADWAATQTLAPENLVVTGVSDHSVWLSWDAVSYVDLGGYNLYVAPAGTASWTLADWTPDKATNLFPVSGLDPDTPYEFTVASFTEPHANNANLVISDPGPSVMATTSNGGCALPIIQYSWGSVVTLSVSDTFDTYLWSTGETTRTITVPAPASPCWYWVKVTSPGSCEETAVELLDADNVMFWDDFETGDTSGWS